VKDENRKGKEDTAGARKASTHAEGGQEASGTMKGRSSEKAGPRLVLSGREISHSQNRTTILSNRGGESFSRSERVEITLFEKGADGRKRDL